LAFLLSIIKTHGIRVRVYCIAKLLQKSCKISLGKINNKKMRRAIINSIVCAYISRVAGGEEATIDQNMPKNAYVFGKTIVNSPQRLVKSD